MNRGISYCILFTLFLSCTEESERKFKIDEGELLDVSQRIIDINTDPVIALPFFEISEDYLIIADSKAFDKGIHIFGREDFKYLGVTGQLGDGPGMISRYGPLAFSSNGKEFWMPDFGKLKMFKYDIDSVLVNEGYLPTVSKPFGMDFFLTDLNFMNEDLAIGPGLEPLSNSTFRIALGKWDLNSGEIIKFGEEHPNLKGERTNAYFDYSPRHQMMVLAHTNHDILTVYDSDGKIKFHLIGQRKFDNDKRRLKFFGPVQITEKYIFTSYLGQEGFELDENQRPKSVSKSKILAFDLEGTLVKVFETGHELGLFVVDEWDKRVICYFNDREAPIGFFYYE